MQIRAWGKNILVQRGKPAEKSQGGIIIPEDAQDRNDPQFLMSGKVLSVGESVSEAACETCGDILIASLLPGCTVIFSAYGGTDLPDVFGERLKFLSQDDILGIVEPEEDQDLLELRTDMLQEVAEEAQIPT
jgi:co-chaperonin GroES (HSP10)